MSGWLPKEILDHLAHAGYVAVPKDRVLDLWATHELDQMETMRCAWKPEGDEFREYIRRSLAHQLTGAAVRDGCIALETTTMDGRGNIRYRANLLVLKPKVIT